MSNWSIFYRILIVHCVILGIITVPFLKGIVKYKIIILFRGFSFAFVNVGMY